MKNVPTGLMQALLHCKKTGHTQKNTAVYLNELGIRTPFGKAWTGDSVNTVHTKLQNPEDWPKAIVNKAKEAMLRAGELTQADADILTAKRWWLQ
ncbi:hypothetical protein UNDYM_2279 [Undibacterium sp. YM2]|uniref:recombinase family protein n=1 Tax=Undibacterium sp. YM2 TaxID=2058625 RepID=UPI001331D6C3|nr:recombinase family protein [Undibacterium sp. YM2]BBB66532.1 hypothetical protein UNDYM_2279 [Undibacterium sp. YM2]